MADNKVYNEKMGYMMDVDLNEKLDDKTKKELKGTKIGELLNEEDERDARYAIFDTNIFDLVTEVQDEYCEGEMDLDEALEILIEGLKTRKGKEEEYRKDVEEDDEEDEDEEDEDD